jgi:NADPH2:quinone reductase
MAVAAGAEVTAVSATAHRGSTLRELGAHTVTDVEDAEGWFDVAMESVGGVSFTATRRKVRPEGQVLWFGQASREPIVVDFFDWVDNRLGATITPFDHALSDRTDAEDLATLVRLIGTGHLHPSVGAAVPWQQTAQVIDQLRQRRLRGNAVLRVTSTDHRVISKHVQGSPTV